MNKAETDFWPLESTTVSIEKYIVIQGQLQSIVYLPEGEFRT